jgi:peptide/nickel transport system permease protein
MIERKARYLIRNKTALLGLIVCFMVLLAVVIGPLVTPYSSETMDFVHILTAPSLAHPFGTDSFGRDVLTRVLAGARISLAISFVAVALATMLGTLMGVVSGYYGGWTDAVLMRLSDLLFAFPSFVLALFLMVVLGFGTTNVILAIALVYVPIFARIARNTTMLIRGEPFVEAARLMARPPLAIMFGEILPNIAAPLLVQASVGLAFGIILEAGLSFVGLGVQPPTPSLGSIMADGREYFGRGPWVLTLSGLFISIALLGINLLGDGIRDVMDPKLRERAA